MASSLGTTACWSNLLTSGSSQRGGACPTQLLTVNNLAKRRRGYYRKAPRVPVLPLNGLTLPRVPKLSRCVVFGLVA
jgi:hypothetical protein